LGDGTGNNVSRMDRAEFRDHLDAARRISHARLLTSRIRSRCWPGGLHDRIDWPALAWLRYRRPEKLSGPIPTCSCTGGRCAVCN
jgi:hypothetical protein